MTVCIHLRETAVAAWGFWWAEERKLVNLLLLHYKPHRMRLVDVTLCYKCRTFRGLCVCPCTCICLAHHWASQIGWTDAFWSADSCGPKEPCFRRAARWRHVANTTELKRHVCGGRVAFFVKLLWPLMYDFPAMWPTCLELDTAEGSYSRRPETVVVAAAAAAVRCFSCCAR